MSTHSSSGTWGSRASSPRSERVIVRSATPADVEAILRLVADVAGERQWLGTEPPLDLEDRRRRYLANLAPGMGAGFVATSRKRVVGELSLWPADPGTLILGMTVAKRWRRHGLGSRLMEAAVEWSRATPGIRHIDLAVFPHNEAALALYRKHGFAAVAYKERAIPRRSGEAWDVILMRRSFEP